MIGYPTRVPIDPSDSIYLDRIQSRVDAKASYAERVDTVKAEWKTKSLDRYKRIIAALHASVSRNEMCAYCESSAADEVEHIKPKDLYPDFGFRYDNYLMSCGQCNRWKSNWYVEEKPSGVEKVGRKPGGPVLPPPGGRALFIDPFGFKPLEYIILDIKGGTFLFLPISAPRTSEHEAARLTIEILGLNDREALIAERKNNYSDYLALAREYAGEPPTSPRRRAIEATIMSRRHPTVWQEMKRQRQVIPMLHDLFHTCTELLGI